MTFNWHQLDATLKLPLEIWLSICHVSVFVSTNTRNRNAINAVLIDQSTKSTSRDTFQWSFAWGANGRALRFSPLTSFVFDFQWNLIDLHRRLILSVSCKWTQWVSNFVSCLHMRFDEFIFCWLWTCRKYSEGQNLRDCELFTSKYLFKMFGNLNCWWAKIMFGGRRRCCWTLILMENCWRNFEVN